MLATALIFDLDDTLMPEHPADDAAFVATLRAFDGRVRYSDHSLASMVREECREEWLSSPHLDFARSIGTSSQEQLWAPEDRSTAQLAGLYEWSLIFRERVWRRVAVRMGLDPGPAWRQIDQRFRSERWSRHRPYPDVIPALERYRKTCRLGLLTNGAPGIQRAKASAAGVAGYFDRVIVSGDFGMKKPDVRLFQKMLEGLEVSPGEAVMIGDRNDTDIAGANAAGIMAVNIQRPDNPHVTKGGVPDALITGLDELDAILGGPLATG